MKDKLNTKNKEKGSENVSQKKKSKSIGRWIFLLAIFLILTFMVFAAVYYLFLADGKALTLPEVQQKYAYDNTIPERIGENDIYQGPEVNSDIYQGQKAYESEQLALAIKHFNKAIAKDDTRFDLKLYSALTHIKLGKDDLGQQLLYQIIDHPSKSLYANEALWYSILIDLNNNNITDAKASLKDLLGRSTNTKELLEKAAELNEELSEFG
ncbi:MAG: hypothetical protein AB8F74_06685 [Saprospiraceae bacterium]